MWNNVVVGFASCLTLIGLVLLPLPIPFGALIFGIGVTMLVTRSERAANVLRLLRARWRRLDGGFNLLERCLPGWAGDVLRRTKP